MPAFAATLNQCAMRHGGGLFAILGSAWVGLLLTGAAYALEPPRVPTHSAPPTFLAATEFEAVSFTEDRTNAAATAPSKPAARNDKQAAQLFGMETDLVAAARWRKNGTTSRPRWLTISRWLRNAVQMGPALSPRKD
jgi:hypothetical protein